MIIMENRRFGGKKLSREDRNKKKFRRDGDGPRRMGRIQRFTIPKGTDINYKNIAFLQKCLTERGKILSRRLTSADASQQRLLSTAVKRARLLGLLPVGSTKRK
ncbi:MAG TPA: 30S ribosomal protein S18 [Candidatus Omnitrophota bacterium]|nr:30S ribosomal protein S18 [Candidatus Omnitrophota bacterium]